MPPKRRTSGVAPKSQQSTLAFHGAANKVTKAGTRTTNVKKNLVSESIAKDVKPAVDEVVTTEETEPTTVEAAIIEQTEQEVAAQQVAPTPEEEAARRITDARIKKYWNANGGKSDKMRVHQKDLSMHEKMLREFDMSGQYGPCTGIARLKRWKRAHRLDLDPPIEVLAVLLKEQDGGNLVIQRSHVDELLNSRADVDA